MEEVWEDPSGLSDFIGMKIEKMHDNVYFPERGTKRPEIEGLRDQWESDMQDLSENDLQYGRNKLAWLYNKFEKEFLFMFTVYNPHKLTDLTPYLLLPMISHILLL